jgi:hypothetical protein
MKLKRTILYLLLFTFVPIVSFAQEKFDKEFFVGTWRTCQDTAYFANYRCSTYLNTYFFKGDGTYIQPTQFANGRYPHRGTWTFKRDTLTLKDSTVYGGVFSAFSINVYKIVIVNKNFFYSQAKSEREFVGHYIYDYFIKQD